MELNLEIQAYWRSETRDFSAASCCSCMRVREVGGAGHVRLLLMLLSGGWEGALCHSGAAAAAAAGWMELLLLLLATKRVWLLCRRLAQRV
jgi:hypothetical protein